MNTAKELFKNNIREYGMLIALVAIMVFFWVITEGTLMRPVNLTNLLLQNSYIIIMAIGMLLIILTGWIDLSVGSVAGFVGGVAAVLIVRYDMNVFLTILISLGVGALIGAAQGYWVAFQKIPPFIVTLAGMLIFRGLLLALLAGESVGPFPEEFQRISSGCAFQNAVRSTGSERPSGVEANRSRSIGRSQSRSRSPTHCASAAFT